MLWRLFLPLALICAFAAACGGGGIKSTDVSAADVLAGAVRELPKVRSFHFKLEHEKGTTRIPLNLELEKAEGDVVVPDRLSAEIEASLARAPVRVKAIGIGDRAWVTNPFTRQWQRLPGNVSLREIANPSAIVNAVASSMKETSVAGRESVDGTDSYVVTGKLDSAALLDAFGTAEAGLNLDVRIWVGVEDSLPRKVRLVGAVTRDETADIVRVVTLSHFNQTVQIEPPGVTGTSAATDKGTVWLAVLCGAGVFVAATDQTSPVAALPDMIDGLGLAQDQFYRAAWLVNGYILGYVVAMPLIGRVADAHGHARVYLLSLALFLAGSAWVAVSQDLTMATAARAFQAAGGGAVVPVAMAIVADALPAERRALGLGAIAAASEAGALAGPLWGGGITELIGWRGLFWINLPLCLPIAAGVWRLGLGRDQRRGGRIDVRGALLIAASLLLLTTALTDDPIEGRSATLTLLLYIGSAASLLLFVWAQARTPEPLVSLAYFRKLPSDAGFALNALMGAALVVAMVSVPLFTNAVLRGSALDGGINLARLTVGLPVGAVAGGVLAARAGYARTALMGVMLAGAGFLGMSRWGSDPGQLLLTGPLLVSGLGLGLVIAPVAAAALNEVQEGERATASALLTVMRLVGALVGVALLTTRGLGAFYAEAGLVPLDDPRYGDLLAGLQVGTFHDVFVATAVVCFLAAIPAALLGRDGKSEQLQEVQ